MLLPLLPTVPGFALDVGVLWLALCLVAFQCAVTVEDCSGELREGSPNPSGLVIATALTHQTMSRV